MSSDAATVDVLLPIRAPAPWLRGTIDSLKSQSYPNWRLVAVLDGRSRDVENEIEPLGEQAKVINLQGSPGLVAQLNAGLEMCSASYVARIDADDIASPKRFELQVGHMASHPSCVAVGTRVRLIDEAGIVTGFRGSVSGEILRRLRWRNALVHPSTMLRLSALRAVGGYSPAAKHGEDYELWLRLATVGRLDQLDEALLDYRIHSQQVTHSAKVDKHARQSILRARVNLARTEGKSVMAAMIRHAVWMAALTAKGDIAWGEPS